MHAVKTTHLLARILPAATLAALVASTGCTGQPVAQRCSRVDLASMGPENGFRLVVPEGRVSTLDDPAESIELALTVVPPLAGPARLVQVARDREVASWPITIPDPVGMSTRCTLAFGRPGTCGASIGTEPHPAAGTYTLEIGGNRILEAALSFRDCAP